MMVDAQQEQPTEDQQIARLILSFLECLKIDELEMATSSFVQQYIIANQWLTAIRDKQKMLVDFTAQEEKPTAELVLEACNTQRANPKCKEIK